MLKKKQQPLNAHCYDYYIFTKFAKFIMYSFANSKPALWRLNVKCPCLWGT